MHSFLVEAAMVRCKVLQVLEDDCETVRELIFLIKWQYYSQS